MHLPTTSPLRRAVLPALLALGLAGCANAPYSIERERSNVRFLTTGEPRSFDSSFTYNAGDGPIVALINPSFYKYKYLKRNPYQLELNIGAELPTVEKLTPAKKGDAVERWTYRLRHDLRFSDDPCFPGGKGRHATAADMVYAIKRMVDPKVNCPVAPNFADKVVGWDDDSKRFAKDGKKAYDAGLTGVRVDPKDPYAFQIDLNQPYPQLRYFMAMAFFSPLSREAIETYGDQYPLHHPIGVGQFRLKEYAANDHVWLVRNPNAYPEFYPKEADPNLQSLLADAGEPIPFVDEIYLKVVTEPVTSYNLFQQGYTDSLGVGAGNAQIVPAANGLTQEMKDRGIQLNKNVEVAVTYMAFNMEDPTFGGYDEKHRKLRQAISLAIDSRAYIDIVAQGMGQPAQWIVPPGIGGYDPSYKNPYRQFDPKLTKAKRLLAEAGYKDGIDPSTGAPLVLKYDNYAVSPAAIQIVRLFQKQIQALGIQVDLVTNQYSTFNDRLEKRQEQFFDFGWNADYPDPENFCFLLYGPQASPGSNSSLYNNPEYNKLFERMKAMVDGPARSAIIAKMRDISVEDCPWIYVQHSESRTLVQPWASNQNTNFIASDNLKYVKLDPAKRVELQSRWNRSILWPIAAFALFVVAVCVPASQTIKSRTNRRVRK